MYCSRDHQITDRKRHERGCKAVKKSRDIVAKEEVKLRNSPGDGFMDPPNPFETSVGHFWGILCTRDYMRARFGLVEALLQLKTLESVGAGADHIADMLRLSRSDNMGVRDLYPAMLLRLGRDQECYDFVKWYATTGQESNYNWGDMDLPYLDVKNADSFESPQYLDRKFADLSQLVSVTLLKIKLKLDLSALQKSEFLSSKLPKELADQVRNFIPLSNIPLKDKKIMSLVNLPALVQKLSLQITDLFEAVRKTNKHFWPALVNPEVHLDTRPTAYSLGSVEEMQLKLKYVLDAWDETPGAIEVIRTKIKA